MVNLSARLLHQLCGGIFFFPFQILTGIYPLAQAQEPYSSVGYLCERVSFLSVLKLQHPSLQDSDQDKQPSEGLGWTAWDVCEGQFTFLTKRLTVAKKFSFEMF